MAMFRCVVNSNLGTEPTLLWENPNPSAVFAAQTISLDLSEYEGVIIEYKILYSVNQYGRTYVKKNESFISLGGVVTSGSNYEPKGRKVSANNDGVIFDGGVSAANTTNNGALIPTKIYGVKNNAQIGNSNLGVTLLWTNPNPTSGFNAQTVMLDLSEYESVIVAFTQHTSTTTSDCVCYVSKNNQSPSQGCGTGGGGGSKARQFFIDASGIRFGNGTLNGSVDNSRMLPLRIYGIKCELF